MKTQLIILFTLMLNFAHAGKVIFNYELDLTQYKDDRLKVKFNIPKIKQDEVVFHLPKVVPGTYSIHNYGSFAHDIVALDKKGDTLKVERLDKNSWKIINAKKLKSISYWVDDTWNTREIKESIFEPAGTNFEEDFFVLNTFGIFGYLKGYEKSPCDIIIKHPKKLYGSTSLLRSTANDSTDYFFSNSYHELADSPMMYCVPDTISVMIGNTQVLVSVYKKEEKNLAKSIMKDIKPLMMAQHAYLGDSLPVKNYAFIITLVGGGFMSSYGALEHSKSSFFYLPSFMKGNSLTENINHIAAHEFLHIITPLNIHSKEIGEFDYINPEMSKHLWMYEGMTEYASHHSQLCGRIVNLKDFLGTIKSKISGAKGYNNKVPFTEISEGMLDKYHGELQNVYLKGALISLCLDLELRHLSNGAYGTQKLMHDLSLKFGPTKSFEDDKLFDIITEMTYPSIRQFFTDHVEGLEPLDYAKYFKYIGVDYTEEKTKYGSKREFKVNNDDKGAVALRDKWMGK
ncbi:peptidase M61 [Paracrocinitomix mangrovi]|uniref:M61 family metallopeptidase n=1 Tax=Paracrocinitomix mangrovi TaxID=2862509 RepID=UPI001C8E76FF|nr:peptidase M61 [Paracrocinitomix mangrovi]UKN03370.1 peptidase M61 [Paracrocinitomix mangrovi]